MKLIVTNTGSPTEYPLHKQTINIGSAADADICLPGEGVAPYHATIWQNRGVFAISGFNNESVRVNDLLITQSQRLSVGDTINVGGVELIFTADQTRPAAPVEAPSAAVDDTSFSALANFTRNLSNKLTSRRGQTASHRAAARTAALQTDNRNDNACYTLETDNLYPRDDAVPADIDRAAALGFQCAAMLFEYDTLLETVWTEQILLHLLSAHIADFIATQMACRNAASSPKGADAASLAQATRDIRQNKTKHLQLEIDVFKHKIGLEAVEAQWLSQLPLCRPTDHLHEPYSKFRKAAFLDYLTDVTKRLPREVGARIWEDYYQLKKTDFPPFLAAMDILQIRAPQRYQDQRRAIPLWRAKLAFVVGGCYYLINVASRDSRGRLLAFKPGKPDDPGEQLTLMPVKGGLIDQQGRAIEISSKGLVTITDKRGKTQVKMLRPTPASQIKATIGAILHQTSVLGPVSSAPDLDLAVCPRAEYRFLIKQLPAATQTELGKLADVPIIINWDLQQKADLLADIRQSHRGLGHHAITIFRTRRNFVFDMSASFFSPAWAIQLSQIISREAASACSLMTRFPQKATLTPRPIPLQVSGGTAYQRAVQPHTLVIETAAETVITDKAAIDRALSQLARRHIPLGLPELLVVYRGLHHHLYQPGETLRYALHSMAQNPLQRQQANSITNFIQSRQASALDMLYAPVDECGFPTGMMVHFSMKLAALARSVTAMAVKGGDRAKNQIALLDDLHSLTNVLHPALAVTDWPLAGRQSERRLTTKLTHPSDTFQAKSMPVQLTPKSAGKFELFLCHLHPPKTSLLRFMNATDDGFIRPLTWSIVSNSQGHLQITLRDTLPPVRQLLRRNQRAMAKLTAQDYLDAYAEGLVQFARNLTDWFK